MIHVRWKIQIIMISRSTMAGTVVVVLLFLGVSLPLVVTDPSAIQNRDQTDGSHRLLPFIVACSSREPFADAGAGAASSYFPFIWISSVFTKAAASLHRKSVLRHTGVFPKLQSPCCSFSVEPADSHTHSDSSCSAARPPWSTSEALLRCSATPVFPYSTPPLHQRCFQSGAQCMHTHVHIHTTIHPQSTKLSPRPSYDG